MKNVKITQILGAVLCGLFSFSSLNLNAEEKLSPDQLYIKIQKICPVSGQTLGSQGTPIKATVGKDNEQVFLCCKGCYSQNIDKKHWVQIHTNLKTAQKLCPVMNKPLPKKAVTTIVKGLPIYTCCPPCVKKIGNDPKTYIQKVNALYAKNLKDISKE